MSHKENAIAGVSRAINDTELMADSEARSVLIARLRFVLGELAELQELARPRKKKGEKAVRAVRMKRQAPPAPPVPVDFR